MNLGGVEIRLARQATDHGPYGGTDGGSARNGGIALTAGGTVGKLDFPPKSVQQITQWEERIRLARVIDPKKIATDRIAIYTTASLKDLTRKMEVKYTLVSQDESDFRKLRISVDSPVGRALLGKKPGEVVEIKVPAGIMKYEVLDIQPANL